MIDLFSEAVRRNPFPTYERLRASAPVFHDPTSGLWLVLDYEGVKWVLSDPATFSSRYGPDWMIFTDPPRHTKLRGLVSRAFTPRTVAALEPRIRELCRELLDRMAVPGEIDLVTNFAAPLPMLVITTEPPSSVKTSTGFVIVVEITDEYGNVETSDNGSVTVALGNNPTGAKLSGTTIVQAQNGVATFTGLKISKAGKGYTLVATSAGLVSVTSTAINVS